MKGKENKIRGRALAERKGETGTADQNYITEVLRSEGHRGRSKVRQRELTAERVWSVN